MDTQDKKKVSPGTELALIKKNITDSVMARLQPLLDSKELRLPPNYSAGNALQSAWFELLEIKNKDKKPALEVCTKESIANSLYRMVTMGLSAAKKQVAFIVYGEKLTCQPEYHGNIALAKRYGGVKQVNAGVIYKNDVFKYAVNTETGRKKILAHEQDIENIDDSNIRGAYCVLTFEDGSEPYLEVMSMDQIKKSWDMGQMKGNSDAHKNFTGEMVKKTVTSRACKLFITSSDDAALYADDETRDLPAQSRNEKVLQSGNKRELSVADTDFEEVGRTHSRETAEYPMTPNEATPAGELYQGPAEPIY